MNIRPILFALVLSLCCCTGCSKEPSYEESELPYGATMRTDKKSYTIPMTYDRRFLEEPEVVAVADLLGSIQNRDSGLYKKTVPEGFFPYLMQVYQYEEESDLMDYLHQSLASQTAEDYALDMVLITDVVASRETSGISQALIMMNTITEDKFEASVEQAWDMTVEMDVRYNDGAGFKVIEDQHVYVFRTADGMFAMV